MAQSVSFVLDFDGQAPAPALLGALQDVEVEDNATMADVLRLRFALAVRGDGADWTVVDEPSFKRLAKVSLSVVVADRKSPLLVGHVIETRAEFSNEPGKSTFEVIAMDPTVLMALEEKTKAWPNVSDSDIAESIFADYGFEADVEATEPARSEEDVLTLQRATDITFLKQLALRNGYECYVDPLEGGKVTAHFHKPRVEEQPQGVLTVASGTVSNVNAFNARFEMLRPTHASGRSLNASSLSEERADADAAGLKDLGRETTIANEKPRLTLVSRTGLEASGELTSYVQGVVDRSSFALVADGELNTIAYGGVLRAKQTVLVRGAGQRLSGTYYVERVHHIFSAAGYSQRFSLRRTALGLTGQEDFKSDSALA